MEMSEILQYIPEVVVTISSAGFIYMVKRYLKKQDDRYSSLAADVKKFSENFLEGLSKLMISQATDTEKHSNTEKEIKRHDKEIDTLYKCCNEVEKKVARIEVKIQKK